MSEYHVYVYSRSSSFQVVFFPRKNVPKDVCARGISFTGCRGFSDRKSFIAVCLVPQLQFSYLCSQVIYGVCIPSGAATTIRTSFLHQNNKALIPGIFCCSFSQFLKRLIKKFQSRAIHFAVHWVTFSIS